MFENKNILKNDKALSVLEIQGSKDKVEFVVKCLVVSLEPPAPSNRKRKNPAQNHYLEGAQNAHPSQKRNLNSPLAQAKQRNSSTIQSECDQLLQECTASKLALANMTELYESTQKVSAQLQLLVEENNSRCRELIIDANKDQELLEQSSTENALLRSAVSSLQQKLKLAVTKTGDTEDKLTRAIEAYEGMVETNLLIATQKRQSNEEIEKCLLKLDPQELQCVRENACKMSELAMEIKLRKEQDEKQESSLCVICLHRQKELIFLPCKHNQVCKLCGEGMKCCPVCRSQIDDAFTPY